jgi:hypothetical protein
LFNYRHSAIKTPPKIEYSIENPFLSTVISASKKSTTSLYSSSNTPLPAVGAQTPKALILKIQI